MNTRTLLLSILAIALLACTPQVKKNSASTSFPALESTSQIFIVYEDEEVPNNSVYIGDLKVGSSEYSSDCGGYKTLIETAKESAKKHGANVIKLTRVVEPDIVSRCYRLKAKLYNNSDKNVLASLTLKSDQQNNSRLPLGADYAVVYFYRPGNYYEGGVISYKLRLDDNTKIGRIRNGGKFEYRTSKTGMHKFWGQTESQDSVMIDIQKGKEYFVRCGLKPGVVIGRPELFVIENRVGMNEYASVK
ncbi:MAG: hypothetical protein ACRCVT_13915 [Leadbetterella sp.]